MAANNRAACRARSKAEFYSKLSIVVEESDESVFWLEILADANIPNAEKLNLKHLFDEAFELLKIFSSSRKTAKNNLISSNHKFNQENNGYLIVDAQVVELVDTQDLKSCGRLGRAGSSPALGTKFPVNRKIIRDFVFRSIIFGANIILLCYYQFPNHTIKLLIESNVISNSLNSQYHLH